MRRKTVRRHVTRRQCDRLDIGVYGRTDAAAFIGTNRREGEYRERGDRRTTCRRRSDRLRWTSQRQTGITIEALIAVAAVLGMLYGIACVLRS